MDSPIFAKFQHTAARRRLATAAAIPQAYNLFQHTAARRRLALLRAQFCEQTGVSTHSRPKAAGAMIKIGYDLFDVSTHSRPKAAGWARVCICLYRVVSTHSRPKAAGFYHLTRMT